jgi:hypothetical protein
MDTMVLERPKAPRNKLNTVVLTTDSASNMELIVALAQKLYVNVLPISATEVEAIENFKLLRWMDEARSEGFADTQETLTKLGIAV